MANGKYLGTPKEVNKFGVKGIYSAKEQYLATRNAKWEVVYPEETYVDNLAYNIPTNTIFAEVQTATIGTTNAFVILNDKSIITVSSNTLTKYSTDNLFSPITSEQSTVIAPPAGGTTLSVAINRSNGRDLYLLNSTDVIDQYYLATPFDITSAVYINKTFQLPQGIAETALFDMQVSPNGQYIYLGTTSKDVVYQLRLNVPWDVTTAVFDATDFYPMERGAAYGFSFSEDGTKVYVVDNTNSLVVQWELATAWDLSTTNPRYIDWQRESFDATLNSVTITSPNGAAFNSDGTKFYIINRSSSSIVEAVLLTPYELSTALIESSEIIAELPTTYGTTVANFVVSPNGKYIFLLDSSLDDVYQFEMITAWDPRKLNYIGKFNLSSEESTPFGIFVSTSGDKLYTIGTNGDAVDQYALSTVWDITTATHEKTFSVSGQDSAPVDIWFSPDGTNMYVLGDTGNDINQYSLGTAWDIATASYVRVFSVGSQTTSPYSISFNETGTKLYVSGSTRHLHYYTLGTAWDLSTASFQYTETSFYLIASRPNIKVYGQYVFYANQTAERLYRYTLGTADDLNTLLIPSGSYGANESAATALFWGDSGNSLYLVGSNGDAVDQFSARVPYKASTLDFVRTFSVSAQESVPQSVYFSTDGTVMFVLGSTGDDVNQYILSSAWDISTASYDTNFSVAAQETVPSGLAFNSDGTKMFVVGQTGDDLNEYTLATAWDVGTASYSGNTYPLAYYTTAPTGLTFNNDGTKIYVTDTTDNITHQINLESAYDITGTPDKNTFFFGNQATGGVAVVFKTDGTKMYVLTQAADVIYEYDLGTAWDVNTAVYNSANFSVAAQETAPQAIKFKTDGTKLYVIGTSGDDVNEYALSTAWDITSASFTTNFSVSSQETAPSGLAFKSDGTKMYVLGTASDYIHQYSLSTAWDVSSASYDDKSLWVLVDAASSTGHGIDFSSDGSKAFIYSYSSTVRVRRVLSYNLSTPWDISTGTLLSTALVAPDLNDAISMALDPNGKQLLITDTGSTTLVALEMSTPFNLLQGVTVSTAAYTANQVMAIAPDSSFLATTSGTAYTLRTYPHANTSPIPVTYSGAGSSSFIDKTLLVSAKETVLGDAHVSPDGTKLFIYGTSSNSIHRYDLSSAWDISTASFVDSLNILSQADNARLKFSTDGTKILVFCINRGSLTSYVLSTAWDLSTASIVSVSPPVKDYVYSTSVSTSVTFTDADFDTDLKFLYVGLSVATVYKFYVYDLLYARKLDNVHYTTSMSLGIYDPLTAGGTTGQAYPKIRFSPDGETLYLLTIASVTANNRVQQLKLNSPYNISDKNYVLEGVGVIGGQEPEPRSMSFSQAGDKLFILGDTGNDITEYTLSTPWDVRTLSFVTQASVGSQTTSPYGLAFKQDGTKAYVLDVTTGVVFQYSLSTAWDISTLSYDSVSFTVDIPLSEATTYTDLEMSPDGTRMVVMGYNSANTQTRFGDYTLSTPWDLSSATLHQYVSKNGYSPYTNVRTSFSFVDSGRMAIFVNNTYTFELVPLAENYNLASPRLQTIDLNDFTPFQTEGQSMYFRFGENGKTLIYLSTTGPIANRFKTIQLVNPWDLQSLSFDKDVFYDHEGYAYPMFWGNEGKFLYHAANSTTLARSNFEEINSFSSTSTIGVGAKASLGQITVTT